MTDDKFGFSTSRKERVAAFSPRTEPRETKLDQVDRIGEKHGFVQREARQERPTRRRKEVGPTVAINMRVPESIAEEFIAYCERNRFSYWEGVAELMRKEGLL